MTMEKFIAGLQIFSKYYTKPDGYHFGAEHDIIYIYATDRPIDNEDDLKKVYELGFHQDEVHEAFDLPDDQKYTTYDPEEGWCTYV